MTVLRVDTIAASGQTSENTGSVFFDGTGDYIGFSSTTDFIQTGDFTMECWIYSTSTSGVNVFLDGRGGSSNKLGPVLYTSGTNLVFDNGAGAVVTATGVITANSGWYHIAGTRSGNTWTLYLNGVNQGTGTDSSSYTSNTGFLIGSSWNNEYFDGYISNVRVVKGTALYTSNFAVPTRELEVTPETVIVCCHDGENIFAEKTGKIISAYGDRLSSPTPTATDSPIGITTFQPGLTRSVDVTAGPTLDGDLEFNSQNFFVLPKGTTTERFPNFATNAVNAGSARGVFGGGTPTPSSSDNVIQYITIATMGDSIDFGDLTITRLASGTASSSTRGVWAGGSQFPVRINNIDYVTISSTGDALDFGDLSSAFGLASGVSNSTRGCFGGGDPSLVNTIQYITIASTGDAKDFGDLTGNRRGSNTCSSPTRGIFAGGVPSTPGVVNVIEYITIASTGDAQDFGDLTTARDFANSNNISNSTRGVFGGGFASPVSYDTIDYVTIATLGNAQNFGDLSVAADAVSGCSSTIRGVFAALRTATPFTITDTIEYISIQTQGNSVDFGNLLNSTYIPSGLSNGHGGLG